MSVEADNRRIVVRILLTQLGAAVVVALSCALAWNVRTGLSALAGAVIGVIANLYLTLTALRPAPTPRVVFRRVWVGQLLKIVLTVVLFIATVRFARVSWLALFAGYVVMLVVFWWLAAAHTRAARPPVDMNTK